MNELEKYQQAANIQIKVRKWLQNYLQPGMNIYNICLQIENKLKKEVQYNSKYPLKQSIAYPVGININNCATHWTPLYNDHKKFHQDDIIKFDFGVQIDGCIIDSAYTHIFNDKQQDLINCSKEALYEGIKQCGVDAILGEIGASIQEVIESWNFKTIPELCGHKIGKYKIHDGKAIPNIKINYPIRMLENEVYAIEPYVTTGTGILQQGSECSHYSIENYNNIKLDSSTNKFYKYLKQQFYTLPFDKKWFPPQNNLLKLINKKIVTSYYPLYDIKGSYISQFEHTIFIQENGVKILTQSDDF